MVGAIAGLANTVLNIGAGIVSGAQQKKISKQQKALIDGREDSAVAHKNSELARADSYYDNNYYTDYADTAEGASTLRNLKQMYTDANSVGAMSGGTMSEEAKMARLANQGRQVADNVSNMAAQGTARKAALRAEYDVNRNNIYGQYQNQIDQVNEQRYANLVGDSKRWDALAAGASKAGAGLMQAFPGK